MLKISMVVEKTESRRPKLMYKLNAGDIEGAAREFLDCDKVGGKRVPGLTRRRRAESRLFLGEE